MTMPRPKLVLLLLHAAAAKIRGVRVLAVGTKPSLGGPLQTPAAQKAQDKDVKYIKKKKPRQALAHDAWPGALTAARPLMLQILSSGLLRWDWRRGGRTVRAADHVKNANESTPCARPPRTLPGAAAATPTSE